jgi:hypothetical protein
MRTLITGGAVVSMDPAAGDLARGNVLITDGVITEFDDRIDAPDVYLGKLLRPVGGVEFGHHHDAGLVPLRADSRAQRRRRGGAAGRAGQGRRWLT